MAASNVPCTTASALTPLWIRPSPPSSMMFITARIWASMPARAASLASVTCRLRRFFRQADRLAGAPPFDALRPPDKDRNHNRRREHEQDDEIGDFISAGHGRQPAPKPESLQVK